MVRILIKKAFQSAIKKNYLSVSKMFSQLGLERNQWWQLNNVLQQAVPFFYSPWKEWEFVVVFSGWNNFACKWRLVCTWDSGVRHLYFSISTRLLWSIKKWPIHSFSSLIPRNPTLDYWAYQWHLLCDHNSLSWSRQIIFAPFLFCRRLALLVAL